jgi:hypothetical protein
MSEGENIEEALDRIVLNSTTEPWLLPLTELRA